ncbi:single-stranded DNA-binding protein [Phycicoccus sp.]|uniref:single-stranded DNA-binding protein n=1 Tax=Phycicoccus sp. TaxID=1902410 RepID=UPI002C6C991F|nr:single-stranded DNA-binding protein [Phycicoccus sp.]HMM94802.1 single-stranded DNA-binding protein [Phycicoccus sp.]
MTPTTDEPDLNTVHLRGRVTSLDEPRSLPSGDVVHGLRVTVTRALRPGASRAAADTVDVACWSPATRRVAGRLVVGERVEVDGAIRRRFFRAGAAPVSRYEVEASRVRRLPPARPRPVRSGEARGAGSP